MYILNLKKTCEEKGENKFDETELKLCMCCLSEKWKKIDIYVMTALLCSVHGQLLENNLFLISEASGFGIENNILKSLFMATNSQYILSSPQIFLAELDPLLRKLDLENVEQKNFIYGVVSGALGMKEGWKILFQLAKKEEFQGEKDISDSLSKYHSKLVTNFLELFDWNALGTCSQYHNKVLYPIHLMAKNSKYDFSFIQTKFNKFLKCFYKFCVYEKQQKPHFKKNFIEYISPYTKIATLFNLDLGFLILGNPEFCKILNLQSESKLT